MTRQRWMGKGGRLAGLLLAAAVLAQLGGCASWFRHDEEGPKPAPLAQFTPSAAAGIVWRDKIGAAGAYVFTPAVADGSVFAAGADGALARFDGASGKQLWRIDTGHKLSGGVGAGDNLVLVGTDKGRVLAYGFDGKPLWQAQLSSEVLSAPQVAGGVVVVRSADDRIFGLDAKDGSRKWFYQRSTPVLTLRSHAGVLITRGAVFAGLPAGRLVALDLASGNAAWEATVAEPRGATELERITDITSLPVADANEVCAVAYQGRVACFDIHNGNLLWARTMSSTAGLAMGDRNLYVSDIDGAVVALDKTTGASVWKQAELSHRQLSRPLVAGPYVAVGDLQGYVHFLSREDGAFAARTATDGSPVEASPLRLGDGLLVQTRDGGLFALSLVGR